MQILNKNMNLFWGASIFTKVIDPDVCYLIPQLILIDKTHLCQKRWTFSAFDIETKSFIIFIIEWRGGRTQLDHQMWKI